MENRKEQARRVRLETSAGDVEVDVFPNRAPVSAGQFLALVERGVYDGATLYRATRIRAGEGIGVIQGGVAGEALVGGEDLATRYTAHGAIAHETTDQTGIPNERGTIAFARMAPGTAGSEFFFNVQDNPVLDSGNTDRNRDGFGYATFGRVVRGMDVLEAIQQQPTGRATVFEPVQGQLLSEPVVIFRASVRD